MESGLSVFSAFCVARFVINNKCQSHTRRERFSPFNLSLSNNLYVISLSICAISLYVCYPLSIYLSLSLCAISLAIYVSFYPYYITFYLYYISFYLYYFTFYLYYISLCMLHSFYLYVSLSISVSVSVLYLYLCYISIYAISLSMLYLYLCYISF